MGFFDLFRNKNKKTVPEEKLSDESLSLSMSLSMSKGTIQEEDSRPDDPEAGITKDRDSITNEEIVRGTKILDTYEVISDAVRGGMGSVWKVRHGGWNTDLAMKRPQPRFFSEGSEKRKENFVRECEAWINLGLHPNIVSCYYVREISGVPTIFSEWMENGSLKNRIEDGSLYEVSEEQKRTGGDRERIIQARLLDIAIQFARGSDPSGCQAGQSAADHDVGSEGRRFRACACAHSAFYRTRRERRGKGRNTACRHFRGRFRCHINRGNRRIYPRLLFIGAVSWGAPYTPYGYIQLGTVRT